MVAAARRRLTIPTDPIPVPTAKQAGTIALARHRINVWEGSIRSGKTVASVVAWLAYVATAPPGELAIIGKTERTVARNILPVIGALVPYTTTDGGILLLGRMVWIVGANDATAEGKLRGMTLAGAYVDEATLVPLAFWRQLLNRLSVPGARLFATTNPDSPHHWLLTDYLENDALDVARFTFRLTDATYLDPAYVAALEAENTGLWRRRFILGEWVAAEGAIYDAWDAARHVRDLGPPITERWVALDYGTQNPFHALMMGRDAAGAVVVESEWRHAGRETGRQMTDGAYADAVIAWATELTAPRRPSPNAAPIPTTQVSRWIVDPSASSFIAELRARSLPVTPADNAVVDGIRRVSNLLDRPTPGLYITSRCPELVREVEGYVWDPKAQARGADEPLKVNDHGPDALRYGVAYAYRSTGVVTQGGHAG